jgi:type IV pilus assembly protein PilO
VSGAYHDLSAFTSDVAKLPRIVLRWDIGISTTPKDRGLVMDAAKTYRYSEEESAAA